MPVPAKAFSRPLRPQSSKASLKAPPPAAPEWKLPFRLRHVLALGLLAALALWAVPRARAAWDIHELAAALGDYGLCMAGPTGPDLIRDDRSGFRRLVRRRLIASAPNETPFARCAASASRIQPGPESDRTHRGRARDFVEYGIEPPGSDRLTLEGLGVDVSILIERTRQAWPFVRDFPARLVRPSLGAKEAMHPVAPPRPGIGRGLPATRGVLKTTWRTEAGYWLGVGNSAGQTLFVSSDLGETFRPVRSAPTADERGGRCSGRDPAKSFALVSAEDGSLLVTMLDVARTPITVPVIRGEHRVLAAACDDAGLVVAARREGEAAIGVFVCPFGRGCAPLNLPKAPPFAPFVVESFDLARISGATVLAVTTRGVVRIVSSRDDGVTWTPPSVAFDADEFPELRSEASVPTRLLALGGRLLLYGAAAKSTQAYSLLVSEDQGASFHAAGAKPSEPAPISRVTTGERF